LTSVTFYGGAAEIGGNKILLEDVQSRIFFDFGMSLGERRKFYSQMLTPKDFAGLIEFEILPKLEGTYRFDESERKVDAVILSHAHVDHFQCISFLRRDIDVYASKETRAVIEAMTETRHKSIENDFSGINWKEFRNGEPFSIGSVKVRPIHVDHSIPGAYGFVMDTSIGPLAYTGDFRKHGSNARLTREFVAMVSRSNPVALLCEGTNIQDGSRSFEADVLQQASSVVAHSKGLVFAHFSAVDLDRLGSFRRVAEDTDRRLAVTPRQAALLSKLKGHPIVESVLKGDKVCVFKKKKNQYDKWERKIFGEMKVVSSEDIRQQQDRWILVTSIYDLNELFDIRPVPGSIFLFSASEPFNEEMEEEHERLRNWLEHFGIPLYTMHSSGHIMPLDLRDCIVQMNPKRLFTIHTSSQKLFSRFMSGTAQEITLPNLGQRYELG
jgi:ribonuclease J